MVGGHPSNQGYVGVVWGGVRMSDLKIDPQDLANHWRSTAHYWHESGRDGLAQVYDQCAMELELAIDE